MINYIIKALLDGDSISINDLGTFTKQYQSARFEGDTMLPPQYVVNLIVQDDQPDGTEFINLLCREKQCRITEAAAEISRWVEELKTALENNKSVSFDNFGTFSLNNKGIIQFVCDHIDELNREFEGMSVVKLGEVGIGDESDEKVNEVQVEKEEEERRLQEEAEQRLREAEKQERLAKEAEERRLQEEAEQRLKEAEEQERLAKEAEERRLQEEAEQRLREAEEQERLAKEAEERRLQEEAEQRLRETEEQERLAKEAEERRLQEEAEQRLREAEEQEKSALVNEEIAESETIEESKEETEEEETEPDVEEQDIKIEEPTEGKKKHRSLWWLFILLILIALGVLGYLFRQQLLTAFNNLKEKITAPKEAVVTEEPETVAEDTIAYDETVAEDTVSEPEVYTPEVVRTTANGNYPVIRFEQSHFYVIAGSLPTEQDAVRHIKQRNLDQYEPKLVMQNGVSNLRVCIGIFDTEEEAETFAKNINPKYWVLK